MRIVKNSLISITAILGGFLLAACGSEQTGMAQAPPEGTEEIIVSVEGMVCMACVGRVNRTLGQIEGVQRVDADLSRRQVRAWIDGERVTPDAIENAIREMGYRTGGQGQDS